MAIVTYPLNNILYNAEDVATYNSTRSTGIYAGDDFAVTLTGADNTLTVDVGMAWMKISKFFGVAVAMKTKTAVDMGLPDTNYPRIDALILRYDANKNATELVVKNGTPASSPKAPEVTRSESIHEIHLYQVRREPSATAIVASKVTDLRLSAAYCGLMADAVTKVDTTVINNQVMGLIEELRKSLAEVEGQTYYASKDYVNNRFISQTVTLTASGWVNKLQTVSVTGVTADITKTDVMASGAPDDENWEAYTESGIRAYAQGNDTVQFKCTDVPAVDVKVNITVRFIDASTGSGGSTIYYPDGDEVAYG